MKGSGLGPVVPQPGSRLGPAATERSRRAQPRSAAWVPQPGAWVPQPWSGDGEARIFFIFKIFNFALKDF